MTPAPSSAQRFSPLSILLWAVILLWSGVLVVGCEISIKALLIETSLSDSSWGAVEPHAVFPCLLLAIALLELAISPNGSHAFRYLFIALLIIVAGWRQTIIQCLPDGGRSAVDLALLVVGIICALFVLKFPFCLRSSMVRLGDQFDVRIWFKTYVTTLCLALCLEVLIVGILSAILQARPSVWPLLVSGVVLVGSIGWSLLSISVLQFMGETVTPVRSLPVGLERLLEKSGLKNVFVFSYGPTHPCGFTGGFCSSLGPVMTIGLREDVLHERPSAELQYVFAHELGHAQACDSCWHVVRDASVVACGLSLFELLIVPSGEAGWLFLSEMTNLPLLLLVIQLARLSFIVPEKFFSRCCEKRADLYALELNESADGMICHIRRRVSAIDQSGINKGFIDRIFLLLGRLNSTHPTDVDRLAMAQQWEKARFFASIEYEKPEGEDLQQEPPAQILLVPELSKSA